MGGPRRGVDLGAGVRGDARVINDIRKSRHLKPVEVEAFRGSDAVFNPTGEDVPGRKNEDIFANRKAQAWWNLRLRFQRTYQAVVQGKAYMPDDIISISKEAGDIQKLVTELSQATYTINTAGKFLIDKAGVPVKRYAPMTPPGDLGDDIEALLR